MLFSIDPGQLKAATACLDRFTAELRRLNDNLEAGRTGTTSDADGAPTPARPTFPAGRP